jgi:hypothetical protein
MPNQPKRPGRKEPTMIIIGCDYHPGLQQIAFVDTETGDCGERRLPHREEAEKFYVICGFWKFIPAFKRVAAPSLVVCA